MTNLRGKITELAAQFASGVVAAIRGASLGDIREETERAAAGGGRRTRAGSSGLGEATAAIVRAARAEAAPADVPRGSGRRSGRGRGGRLGRRSSTQIAQVVESIVELLQKNSKGLRAEGIKKKLGLQSKELPRPIAEALASKKITKQGQKRATTYFAAGARPAAAAGAGRPAARPAAPAKKAEPSRRSKKAKGGKSAANAKVVASAKIAKNAKAKTNATAKKAPGSERRAPPRPRSPRRARRLPRRGPQPRSGKTCSQGSPRRPLAGSRGALRSPLR